MENPPSFTEARQALLGRKPPTTVLVDVFPAIELPDAFLLELGRLITRFGKLKAAVVRVLDRPTDCPNSPKATATLRGVRLTEIVERLHRSAGGSDEHSSDDFSPTALIDTYTALETIVAEYTSREWTAPAAGGVQLENWPPIIKEADSAPVGDRFGNAANEPVQLRQEPGTKVSTAEMQNLSEICTHLYRQLCKLTRTGPAEYGSGFYPPFPR